MKILLNFKSNPLVIIALTGFILHIVLWVYTLWVYAQATDLIPLHYTIYFGIDLIGYKSKLFIYPIMGSMVILINSLLAHFLRSEKLIIYFLASAAILVQIILLATETALVFNYY